ncbi:hypothetical protein [Octadecabacter antarcticus]|uniref:hypothetical protein n=1 Tax=Octadecabacter antarcticus TaxID=1217908 RepID=UPI0002F21657|nr:hypothetical protein [Octadecabacter antarcticus]
MANEKIKTATEVVTDFLDDQVKDQDLELGTVQAVGSLRDEGKLTKINLLRQLEALRKAAISARVVEGGADD